MAYVQRFGISRKSPLALLPKSSYSSSSKKKDPSSKLDQLKKKYSSSSSTPGHDIIERNVMVGDTTAKPNKFYQTPEEFTRPGSGSNMGRSSKKDGGSNWLDYAQDTLTGVGMIPGVGIFADGANFLLSGGRAIHGALTGGDVGKHVVNMGLAAGGAIPGIGQGVSGTKLASKVIPKTVKGIQNLDKASKILKVGELAGKAKKIKTGSKYLLSTTDSEPYVGYTPKNVSP
tara:strand:+ start:165 stop:854 length:690 start_codon:yes stop_codon:yes gene_type:complete